VSGERRISYPGEALRFAQELIRVESLSGAERGVADLVQAEMEMLGYDRVTRDALGNVIGVVRGVLRGQQRGGRLLFDAHMDTVPVTEPDVWTHGPLSGEVTQGRLWGRGAADVKGSLAAVVVAVGSLAGRLACGEIVVAATVGEEMIEGLALEHVLKSIYPVDAERVALRVIVCEPTGLRLGIGHKGRTGLVVHAQGQAAHSSRPEEGINAIYRMIEAVAAIRRLPPTQDKLLGRGVTELVEIISHPYPGTSMVPSACQVRFDRRLVRGETKDTVLGEMAAAVAAIEGVSVRYHRGRLRTYTGCEFEVDDFQPAWAQPEDTAFVRAAQGALRAAGLGDEVFTAPYCTNASVVAGRLGLPCLLYGAGEVTDAHIVDESVSIEDLAAAWEGYRALALRLTNNDA
jgi:putative selenium metabolism hydrolase